MWDILGAVFGGAYLAGKVSSERSASMEAAQKRDEWKHAFDEWSASVTNKSLEAKLELFIHQRPQDAAQKAKALCNCIPEDQHNNTTYLRVLLAEHGKIRSVDAGFGIETPLYSATPVLKSRQQYMAFYQFIWWIKESIEKNGAPKADMFFVPAYPGNNSTKYHDLHDTSNLMRSGTYVWFPQRIGTYLDKR